MCGIVGYYHFEKMTGSLDALYQATRLITHRGPDDEGYAFFNTRSRSSIALAGPDSPESLKIKLPRIHSNPPFEHNLAFGFRRFSIVDLTENGHQPFWTADGKACLIFNGEIYNYLELKQELLQLGCTFRTTCDTEVLLTGYRQWGMDVLKKCNGPIAMVLYDLSKRQLIMARDRLGKSPLYYAMRDGTLYWGSEIKSILTLAGWNEFKLNDQAIYDYLRYGWRDLDYQTFWEGVFTLPAASWVALDLDAEPADRPVADQCRPYWQIPADRVSSRDISLRQAQEHFYSLFEDAIRIRARADAKVAFSLSGGLDSSSIVAAAASMPSDRGPFRTYSISYPGEAQNEEPLAHLVAERYAGKIDYQTYTPGNNDFWQVADQYIWLQEEPFHFPNAELFQAYFRQARTEGYKVMIIGAGGDELLAGYGHYFMPYLADLRAQGRYGRMLSNLWLKTDLWPKYQIRKRLRLTRLLFSGGADRPEMQMPFSLFNTGGHDLVHQYLRDPGRFSGIQLERRRPAQYNELLTGSMTNWLMHYWLRNGNKSHFGVPMETRSPFLDYRLVDYVFRLPPDYLIHQGWSKYLLRKTMDAKLPPNVVWNRTKRGLPFNNQAWFSHAKGIVRDHLKDLDDPYMDWKTLLADYDGLLVRDPFLLWRCINFGLWWKRVIERKSLTC